MIQKIQGLEIQTDYKWLSEEEAKQIATAREESILTLEQLGEKIATGEAVSISSEDSKNPVYLYVAKDSKCPMSKVHFYDAEGRLMFTYPWNGMLKAGDKKTFLLTDDIGNSFDHSTIHDLEAVATEKGKIAIREKFYCVRGGLAPHDEYRVNLFNNRCKRESIVGGIVDWSQYDGYKLSRKELDNDNPKYGLDLMKAIEKDGDKFIDYAKSRSYVV